jgi:peptidoglycan/LPS O-acetylase OafA/YrhL
MRDGPSGPRLAYQPALDGIRGLAILLVLAIHFHLPLAQGGRIGVTLFFVLSGYLITSLLVTEQARTGRISMSAFYWRRARRLLPALFVLIAAVLLVEAVHGHLTAAIPAALATTFYVANFALRAGVDMGLLQHTWSLAVEEQFYVWWPLAFVGVMAWKPHRARTIVVVAALAVIAYKVASWLSGWDGFLPTDRADALLAGCALAVVARPLPGWLGMAGIGAALVLSTIVVAEPAGWLLVTAALIGAVVVGSAINEASLPARILAWAPLVAIGKISYSLYLWHQPVARELDRLLPGTPQIAMLPLYVAVTATLAYASYRWVEQPFRRMRNPLDPERRPPVPVIAESPARVSR